MRLDAYTTRQLADFFSLLKQAERKLVSIGHLTTLVKERLDANMEKQNEVSRKARENQKKAEKHRLKCPECRQPMLLLNVNDKPETMVGGDFVYSSLCLSCHYDEFYTGADIADLKNVPIDR
jgi:Zn finger protein HypA/HybF involved in hydrogenase expression